MTALVYRIYCRLCTIKDLPCICFTSDIWCAAVGVNIMMNEIYIVQCYYNSLTSSYGSYSEYYIDDLTIVLSDDNDMDIADNRILTERREMGPMLQSLPLQVISRTCCHHRDEDH